MPAGDLGLVPAPVGVPAEDGLRPDVSEPGRSALRGDPPEGVFVPLADVIPQLMPAGDRVSLILLDQPSQSSLCRCGRRWNFAFGLNGAIWPALFCKCLILFDCGTTLGRTT